MDVRYMTWKSIKLANDDDDHYSLWADLQFNVDPKVKYRHVPLELQSAVTNFLSEHPFLHADSTKDPDFIFNDDKEKDGEIFNPVFEGRDHWSPSTQNHGEFWVYPKDGFSFDESEAAAPHTSHCGDISDMIRDILTLKPCKPNCKQCGVQDTSMFTHESIKKTTQNLLDKHHIPDLLKKYNLISEEHI